MTPVRILFKMCWKRIVNCQLCDVFAKTRVSYGATNDAFTAAKQNRINGKTGVFTRKGISFLNKNIH